MIDVSFHFGRSNSDFIVEVFQFLIVNESGFFDRFFIVFFCKSSSIVKHRLFFFLFSFLLLIIFYLFKISLIVLVFFSFQFFEKHFLIGSLQLSGNQELFEKESQFHGDKVPTFFEVIELFEQVYSIDKKLKVSLNKPVDFRDLQLLTNVFALLFELRRRTNCFQTLTGLASQ